MGFVKTYETDGTHVTLLYLRMQYPNSNQLRPSRAVVMAHYELKYSCHYRDLLMMYC